MNNSGRLRSDPPAELCPAVVSAMGGVVGPGHFYQGKLFVALLSAFAASLVIASVLAWLAERRMRARPFWQVLVCAAGLPMLTVAGILLALGFVHPPGHQAVFGQPEAFAAIRSLIPVVLVATLSYVIGQLHSSRRGRLAAAAIWFMVASVATQAWVLRVSFDNPHNPALWSWDSAVLGRTVSVASVLVFAGATVGLLVRLGKGRRQFRLVPAAAYLAAAALFVWPVRFPASWTRADIGPLLGAYCSPAGDLIVHAYPAPQRALGAHLSVVLARRHGQDGFRAVTRFPVWRALSFSPDLRCAELTVAVPLLDRLWGAYCRRSLMDLSTNEVLENTTSTLQGRFDWGTRTLGPERSWFTIDADRTRPPAPETVRGMTTRGVPFVQIQDYDERQNTRSWFVAATSYSIGHTSRRSSARFVAELRTVDLERGSVSVKLFDASYIGHIVGVSPEGRRFVVSNYSARPKGRPWCFAYRLYEISGESRPLGPTCSEDALIPVWLETGDPMLLPECDVTSAMREATLHDDERLRDFRSDAREMGGRIFMEQGSRFERAKMALLELTRDGKHALAIAAGPVSVQWLSDSIVWCEQTSDGGRAVRFYPSEDRYELLLSVP